MGIDYKMRIDFMVTYYNVNGDINTARIYDDDADKTYGLYASEDIDTEIWRWTKLNPVTTLYQNKKWINDDIFVYVTNAYDYIHYTKAEIIDLIILNDEVEVKNVITIDAIPTGWVVGE